MKQVLAIMTLLAGLAGMMTAPQALAATTGKYHVVIQVSEDNPKVWNLALNNAENLQQALGKDNVDVEIVAYGPGLKMLLGGSKVAARVNGAMDASVDIVACGTTMRKMKKTKADLIGGSRVVAGGVIEISDKQRAGWSYIRP
jgi:intracellular sulfur oxidation DsrE/DsrF family protein